MKGGGSMRKTNIKYALAVVLPVAFAVLCHSVSYNISLAFPARILDLTRTFIYMGLFLVWGFSINRRVIKRQTRSLLTSVCALEVFWLTVREIKFRFISDPEILRHLWYAYYIPIILIPLLSLYISMLLGKPESYKLSRNTVLFSVPSLVLLFLILTNDFHQLAFRFPENAAVFSEREYTYGIVYYLTFAWVIICSLLSFILMFIKSRLPKNRKRLPLPLIVFFAAAVYSVLYGMRIEFVLKNLGDVAVVFCLFFTAFFESCIQSGLIQSNTRYFSLFSALSDVEILITDKNYNIEYSSKHTKKAVVSDMRLAEKEPIITKDKKRLYNMPVYGGRAIWSEDISEIIGLTEKLRDTQEELRERNALLQLEYEKEKEHRTVEEQNRLFDLLQNKTQPQLNRITSLVQEYKTANSKDEKKQILAEILIFGTFIKRNKDFIISMEYADEFPELMLISALRESFRALRLLDIEGSFLVNTNRELISGETLSLAYDFFEDVIEAVLGRANYINLRLCEIKGRLRISILTDCEECDSFLDTKYPEMIIENDESLEFILNLEGGEKK